MQLDGSQKKILREGIINAYRDEGDLKILLEEEMDVHLKAIAKGENYNQRVFHLIEDFQTAGILDRFIRIIIRARGDSPVIEPIIAIFGDILPPSNVKLIPSAEKVGVALPLLIVDPLMSKKWDKRPEDICIYKGINLASPRLHELGELKVKKKMAKRSCDC